MNRCANCNCEAKKRVHGLCPACRMFFRRNGRHRTAADMIRRKSMPHPLCSNCHISFVDGHRTLCSACRQYQRVHGVPRPSKFFSEACTVCGRPKRDGFANGLCRICYNYRRKFGRDRSNESIKRLYPLGWCECGRPATEVMNLRIGKGGARFVESNTAFALCGECKRSELDGRYTQPQRRDASSATRC